MQIQPLLKKSVPHVIAVVLFLVLTVIFYFPMFFQGKTLNQNDINQGFASAQEISEYRDATGEEPLWTNSMFGGMPAYMISVHWSGQDSLNVVEKVISLGLPTSARETFLCMLCFYVLLLAFGVRPALAMAGAIAYGFSTFFIISIEAGHIWKVRAIAYAPLVVAGVHLTFIKKYWLGLGLGSLALALEFNSNHPQITYYVAILLGVYVLAQLVQAIRQREIKSFLFSGLIALAAILLAVGANLGKLWSSYEYGNYSIRGKSNLDASNTTGGLGQEYAFTWSSGKAETLTYLVPHFYGGASGGYHGSNSDVERALLQNNAPPEQIQELTRGTLSYWGDQPWVNGPVYAGAAICFLFVLGIIYADKTYKWWLISATILAVLLSWGKNFAAFNYFIFDTLPLYNKFRAVSMTAFIAMLTMPLLGMIGLEKVLQQKWNKEVAKNIFIAAGCTAGLALIIAIVAYVPDLEAGQVPDWFVDAVRSSRKTIVRVDAFRTIFFIAATFTILFFYLRQKLNAVVFFSLLILIVSVDFLTVDHRYVNSENYVSARRNTFLSETPADEAIARDKALNYRVLNFNSPFTEARTSAFHHSIGGYHGAKLGRYQDLIDTVLNKEINGIVKDGTITEMNTRILSMLNTKYFLTGLNANNVIGNPYANGTSWFVQSVKEVNSPNEELSALPKTNLHEEVVIDVSSMPKPQFTYDSSATIKMTSYAPNHLAYEANTTTDGYAVFSEIYYPKGWHATIDDKEVPIDRVDYLLRGLSIPAGKHTIKFDFTPRAYTIGNPVMMASSIILLLLFVFSLVWTLRKTSSTTNG